jgi:hypothetical protein
VSNKWFKILADDRFKFMIPALVLTLAGFWVAYQFVDLRGKRLAVGPEGSGTRAMALQLLRDNAMLPPVVELLPLSGAKALQSLR